MWKNIILIGFSFTGKSSAGRLVAERLGWSLVDLDQEVVKTTGKAIPDIFSREGEKAFRDYESQVLKEVLQKDWQVVATGGGVVISEANRRLMKDSGLVVCLEARPETIYRRLLDDRQRSSSPEGRPLLSGDDPLARITALKEARQRHYREAHATVATDDRTVEEVASAVIAAFRGEG